MHTIGVIEVARHVQRGEASALPKQTYETSGAMLRRATRLGGRPVLGFSTMLAFRSMFHSLISWGTIKTIGHK